MSTPDSNAETSTGNDKKRKVIIGAVVAAAIIVIIAYVVHARQNQTVTDEGYYLDTVCQLSVMDMKGGMNQEKAKKAVDRGFNVCRRLDKKLSNTVAVSDISRINNAGGQWVTVGDDALRVIKAGVKYGDISDGMFDITIGTVTDLWDFHSDKPKLPDQAKLSEALTHVNYKNIQIDGNRVRLLDPEAKIDLGGIGKGYVGDRVVDEMKKAGVTSGIVNLGGNVITIGGKPNGDKFSIGIEKPFSDRSETVGSTPVRNKTVVTSGVYEREFKKNGKIYYHILNAKTGYPAETDLDSATLVMNIGHSMDADAMSTICLMKGSKGAKKFIDSRKDVEGVLCLHDGSIEKTKGMNFKKAKN